MTMDNDGQVKETNEDAYSTDHNTTKWKSSEMKFAKSNTTNGWKLKLQMPAMRAPNIFHNKYGNETQTER